jgi:hypothetical protein
MATKSTKGSPATLTPPPPTRSTNNSGTKGSPEALQSSRNLSKEPPTENVPLNFKVPSEFRRELKIEAADRGMSMTSLLLEMYEYWKQHHR